MSLQGVLNDFGVPEIFQLIAQQRKTGILEVDRGDRKLEIHFCEGGVLRALPSEPRPDAALATLLIRTGVISEPALAEGWRKQEETLESLPRVLVASELVEKKAIDEVRRLLTDETIFELMLFEGGSFCFRPCEVERTDTDSPVGAEMVLLDALRMRDEWTQIEGELIDLSVVVAPCADLDAFRERAPALHESTGLSPADQERVFALVDGRLSARRIIDLSRLGTFTGGRALVTFLRQGLLELESLSDAGEPMASYEAPRQRSMLALGLLVVCGALGTLLLSLPVSRSSVDFPIPESALADLYADAGLERVRVALEAYRWAHGEYPRSLDRLPEAQDPVLAPLLADRYSYSRSPEGYELYAQIP